MDRFAAALERPTVLVVDNAPIHTSHEFKDNMNRWKGQKLTVLPIAPYSPELNLIEILPAHRCAAPALLYLCP
ncbi:MAG: transposase [Methylovulum sp.]|nr:transposase [Methylovulum sp.]